MVAWAASSRSSFSPVINSLLRLYLEIDIGLELTKF
jgi:hypothetical protein